MAIYLLHVKTFGRATGGRVTRAAAYRAGERIRDERTREVYRFTDREDVAHKEIVLPAVYAGDSTMDWARDRSTLWNAAERTDRRNARLARELLILLPPELKAVQRTRLVQRFAQDLADRYRSAVDTTIHLPRPTADARGHHAHLLMTARQVTPGGLGPRTSLELSATERYAAGLGPYRADFMWARERWAEVVNEALKEAGLTARVDHRGARARGLDQEPVPLLPQKILYMERQTGPTRAGDDIRARYRERVEARRKGADELARVIKQQKEEGRRRILERSQRNANAPKKIAWSALTKAELAERRRNRYQSKKAVLNQKRREKRAAEALKRVKLTAEQQSAQRWLRWRQKQAERLPEPAQPGKAPQDPAATHTNTDDDGKRRGPRHERDHDYEP